MENKGSGLMVVAVFLFMALIAILWLLAPILPEIPKTIMWIAHIFLGI